MPSYGLQTLTNGSIVQIDEDHPQLTVIQEGTVTSSRYQYGYDRGNNAKFSRASAVYLPYKSSGVRYKAHEVAVFAQINLEENEYLGSEPYYFGIDFFVNYAFYFTIPMEVSVNSLPRLDQDRTVGFNYFILAQDNEDEESDADNFGLRVFNQANDVVFSTNRRNTVCETPVVGFSTNIISSNATSISSNIVGPKFYDNVNARARREMFTLMNPTTQISGFTDTGVMTGGQSPGQIELRTFVRSTMTAPIGGGAVDQSGVALENKPFKNTRYPTGNVIVNQTIGGQKPLIIGKLR
jgi:hypothetical protein